MNNMKIKNIFCGIGILAMLLGGATGSVAATAAAPSTSQPVASNTTTSGNATASGNTTAASKANKPAADEGLYYLRPLDTIAINVVDDPTANQDSLRIGQDGMVKLSYLDDSILLKGLTTTEASKKIADAYKLKKIYVNPQINVSIKIYSEQHVFLSGQVNRPGTVVIPPEEKLTLSEAFNMAGGPTGKSAKTCNVTRTNADGTTQLIQLNLWDACHGDKKANIELQDKDSVDVNESWVGSEW